MSLKYWEGGDLEMLSVWRGEYINRRNQSVGHHRAVNQKLEALDRCVASHFKQLGRNILAMIFLAGRPLQRS